MKTSLQNRAMLAQRGSERPARVILSATLAVVVVNLLGLVIVPFAYAVLLIPFLEHDGRGMPVEPPWVGWLALYGGTAAISACVGYVLGNVSRFRFSSGLVTGFFAGAASLATWYAQEALRGYQPDLLTVISSTFIALACTAPFMAVGAWAGSS